ncbi:MAG TPA: GIY-YIG nuclease family protein, partial [Candidatus Dojkabacteria bacterium]|nr:GIY-YIG nuclease family protein [Candidatus Dojkabacteria bacterium]
MKKELELKLNTLPNVPGIYKFLNNKGEILYIGKAIDLKKRVSSYFLKDPIDRPRIMQMLPQVSDIEIVETNNEIEALILESALVKKYQPLYNTDLKDDKSYAWIYINTKDEFPTVKIVRTIRKGEYKKGRLFGPYPSGYAI